ncbi:unnamed protein product, partial [Rotaria sp. Silwood2]
MTATLVTSALSNGSKWVKAVGNEPTAWVNDKVEVMKVSIQNGWQNVIGHIRVLWWWSKLGFAVGTFVVVLFGAIYLYR